MWLVCCAMAVWIVWPQGYLVIISFAIRFDRITAVFLPSHEKFVTSLANILSMTYHTCRYINAIVCASQVLFQWESFIFCHGFETYSAMDLLSFSMATTKFKGFCKAMKHLWFAFVTCSKQVPCSSLASVQSWYCRCFVGNHYLRIFF